MKKTFNLSISGSLFCVEEDAYQKLDAYLTSVREYFKNNDDQEDILNDIEYRIVEHFSEKQGKIVTMYDVEEIIRIMGTVSQFENDAKEDQGQTKMLKRLYRDTDNGVIGGVSSGLGHFFGIDPVFFRLGFFISLVLGGSGFIVYIILWILIPEAKTSSQKLSMRGASTTISAMADVFKEKVKEVNTKEHKNTLKKLIALPIDFIRAIVDLLKEYLFPLIRVLAGIFLTGMSFIFVMAMTMGASFFIFALNPSLIEEPLLAIAQSSTAQLLVLALYITFLIPLICLISLGIYMITRRMFLRRTVFLPLVGIWFIVAAASGALGVKIGAHAANVIQNDSYYKKETSVITVPSYTKLKVNGHHVVKVVQGSTSTIEFKARPEDLTRVTYAVENNVLTISEIGSEKKSNCLACEGDLAEITVTTPNLSLITVTNGGKIEGEYEGNTLELNVDKNSSASLGVKVNSLITTLEEFSRVNLHGKTATFTGGATSNSEISAESLMAGKVTLTISNDSHAEVYASTTLNVMATNGSEIEFGGNPKVTENIDSTSRLHAR